MLCKYCDLKMKLFKNISCYLQKTKQLGQLNAWSNYIVVRSNSTNLNLKIEDITLNKYIGALESEYNVLKQNPNNLKTNSRLIELKPVIDLLKERHDLVDNVVKLDDLLKENDSDLKKLAEEERAAYETQIQVVDDTIKERILLLNREDDINSIALEINAGVGGQEAMLFASEMFDMYRNFVEYKGWSYQLAEYLTTEMGGIRHGSILINGNDVFRYFKHEAGVHRVQRIPATEKQGRIHTSTVSVLALPQPTDIQIDIQSKDLKIETKRATGAGGQHVNTTDSAVRIVHLPTGTAVECQTDRSQIRNRETALQRLKALLYQQQLDSQIAEQKATKKSQVKSNFRNEKIRTYNFSQDRITDHRLTSYNVHNLKTFMLGGEPLENLICKLDYNNNLEMLREIVQSIK